MRAGYAIERAAIPDVLIIHTETVEDPRGAFTETFRKSVLAECGVTHDWAQDNRAATREAGVVRGMHFQAPPFAQAKLLRVERGAIHDVAVDLRAASPTYGRHVGVELSAENGVQLYIPIGFAHGYCTLAADTVVLYKASTEYAPGGEGGLRWNDPALAINWPALPEQLKSNQRDLIWPDFAELQTPF